MVDKWNNNIQNGSTRRKTCPSITDPLHITQTGQGLNQGLRDEKVATNRFGYGAPSPPSSAQVMNRWSHTPTPPLHFHGRAKRRISLTNACNGCYSPSVKDVSSTSNIQNLL